MGKLQLFEISFDPSQPVFIAGSVVRGTVKLELKDTLKMRGVRITCFGRAHVHWSEVENVGHRGGRQRVETVDHTAEEEYFQFRTQLWPDEQSSEDANNSLGAGQYTFPFEFQLPSDLPPSFEGAFGYIRYWIKATIDEPWKFDHHTKRAFSVIPCMDINQYPGIGMPIEYRGELRTGCCCVPSGRYKGSLSTTRKGFVPGSEIGFNSEIENLTGSTCWAEITLKMHITYQAEGKFKQEKKVISSLCKEQIPRGKNYVWKDRIQVPPLPPSHLKGCKLIDCKYILQIDFEDEIVIGTLPLVTRASARKSANAGRHDSIVAGMPGKGALITVEGNPSYEECSLFSKVSIKDKDDTEHTFGELVFTPLYAFYSNKSSKPRIASNTQ
ncbi:unnamed protein product [Candidula unifasciata]|uniref:Arrestin C-terminal-like domain-containing protein n=1 Tax=Candidula unifasciata TaxID=100452 RepID=A0A8S3Z0I8_9EUPU|nr:unnamed protein product [Candidula unifasciata]